MEEKFKEAQRKIDRVPAKSPLQESIKEALQEILDCIRRLLPNKVDNTPKMEGSRTTKKSKTPVIPPHNVPKQTTGDLGPDPRDREAKADLNFNLDE